MKKSAGFTLIELLIFVVVMGVVASLFVTCYVTVLRNSPSINRQLNATQIAATCVEWYLGQRYINGFSSNSLNIGSTTPTFCTVNLPAGYSVASSISNTTLYGDTAANYKTITVAVTGPGRATLSTIIANY